MLLTELRSVQTMQLFSLEQGTVSQWSIVPRCPRVLQVLPTMWDSSQVSQLSHSDIVGTTCNTLGHRGTMLHGDTVPCQGAKLHRLDRPLDRIKASTHYQVNLTNMLDLNTNSSKLDHLYGETSSNNRLDKLLEA